MAAKVKVPRKQGPRRRNGHTRLSTKNQVTIPVQALAEAGIRPGDELRVDVDRAGRIVLTADEDVIEKYAGAFAGVYEPGYLEKLRSEWDRSWDPR